MYRMKLLSKVVGFDELHLENRYEESRSSKLKDSSVKLKWVIEFERLHLNFFTKEFVGN